MNSTSTSNTSTGHSGIGSKIKGAAQVVNGLGENIRGTFLGGVDTIVHSDSTKNDAIARKGREEQAQGVANLEQRPIAAKYTGGHAPLETATHESHGMMAHLTHPTSTTTHSVGGAGLGYAAPAVNHGEMNATGEPAQMYNTSVGAQQGTESYSGGAAAAHQGYGQGATSQPPSYTQTAMPGTGPPASGYTGGSEVLPGKQQGYGATDAMNRGDVSVAHGAQQNPAGARPCTSLDLPEPTYSSCCV
ncbi:hypothetical protein C8J57DRAFT_1359702 [Mycena rebaudengoi]|nr:hypothetical protein C8J57DRAFT_1359702 [Mycena rebaudengoi]